MGWSICPATAENKRQEVIARADWATGVNQKVRRESTWGEVLGFITDETLSGKTKRRYAHSLAKRPFSVSMLFTYTEYLTFSAWYNNTIKRGTLSFTFPKIDGTGNAEYRITSAPTYANESGKVIRCTMEWEEV